MGKSTLVTMFAEKSGMELIVLNFEREAELGKSFQGANPTEIIATLEILFDQPIVAGKTLLFFDEIQAAPSLLRSLRYFYEERPGLHIIAAGSLLDFELSSPNYSIPVGRISYLHLGPMTFIEFLYALEKDKLAQFVMTWRWGVDIPEAIHQTLSRLLRQYMLVGGMPEAVLEFTKTHTPSYRNCERIKTDLLATFRDDFSKYATPAERERLDILFSGAPRMLGHKVKYSNISKHHRAKDLAKTIHQLSLARVIHKIHKSSSNGLPLRAEENPKFFKILFLDTGLVSTQLGLDYKTLENENPLLVNAASIAEQYVGQALLHSMEFYQTPALNYWAREKKSSSAEIDYVIGVKGQVIPIEVKAGKTGRLKSLHLFMEDKQSRLGVRFNSQTPSYYKEIRLLSLPLYLAESCRSICENILGKD